MVYDIHQKIYRLLKKAERVLLLTHDSPDGDGLSSLCLLIELLENMSKPCLAYCYDPPPRQFSFLPHWEKIISQREKLNFTEFDLIIALDCGSLERTHLLEEIRQRDKKQLVIEIDHHPGADGDIDLGLRDEQAASTTEILYHLLKANQIKINKNMANCVLTGILTDTANFLYPATSSATVEIASAMLSLGAQLPQIMEHTWRNKSLASMKVWGAAMSRLRVNPKYNFAVSVLTLDDIKTNQVSEEELEGIAGFISNLGAVKGVLLLRQQADGIIRGSLRTSDRQIDVARLAKILGGGGHAKASGFKIKGQLEKIANGWKII